MKNLGLMPAIDAFIRLPKGYILQSAILILSVSLFFMNMCVIRLIVNNGEWIMDRPHHFPDETLSFMNAQWLRFSGRTSVSYSKVEGKHCLFVF